MSSDAISTIHHLQTANPNFRQTIGQINTTPLPVHTRFRHCKYGTEKPWTQHASLTHACFNMAVTCFALDSPLLCLVMSGVNIAGMRGNTLILKSLPQRSPMHAIKGLTKVNADHPDGNGTMLALGAIKCSSMRRPALNPFLFFWLCCTQTSFDPREYHAKAGLRDISRMLAIGRKSATTWALAVFTTTVNNVFGQPFGMSTRPNRKH